MQEHFEQFAAMISGIHGNIKKLKAAYTDILGIKEVHIFWIYLLKTHPEGMTASELATAGKSSRSLVSREISELQEEGIIYTDENTGRRRYGWKFLLTEKGQELARRISSVAAGVQSSVSYDIPPEDLATFYKTLHILSDRFDKLATEKGDENERKNTL